MNLDKWDVDAFREYAKPLKKLEEAFIKAGLPLTFHAFTDSFGNKLVKILHKNRSPKIVSIEGDSPAQAVKDVAAGVRL